MKKIFIYLLTFGVVVSCEDFVDLQPTNQISNDIVFTSPSDAEAIILGMYEDGFQATDMFGESEIGLPGLLSDELVHTGSFPTFIEEDRNDIASTNGDVFGYWDGNYEGIYLANFLLENIENIEISIAQKNRLRGEALFGRAYMHFNIVRYFGDAPLALSTDLNELSELSRTPKAEAVTQILADLTEAATLLQGATFPSPGDQNFRATEWAAKALAARINLYMGNVTAAGNLANDVITNGGFSLMANYSSVFASGGNTESIMKCYFDAVDGNSLAFFFNDQGRYEYAPSQNLVDAIEVGDSRFAMIGTTSGGRPMAVKYSDVNNGSDQPVIFRLAEMLLIRAEANLTVNPGQALIDINAIRIRAGVAPLGAVTLDDIIQERFVELAFEGHRWMDLQRTGRIDAVMSAINPTTWQPTDALLPVPQTERERNTNLSQNPGY